MSDTRETLSQLTDISSENGWGDEVLLFLVVRFVGRGGGSPALLEWIRLTAAEEQDDDCQDALEWAEERAEEERR